MGPAKKSIDYFDLKLSELLEGKHEHHLPCKSSEKSTEARQAGNKLFNSKNHDEEIHVDTLSLYTKSIALAEENSEELALGYGNRSALLIHLKKYKECLIDIERACEITKSDELKIKLAARKQQCLLQLDKVKESEQKTPPLDFKPSKDIPCASDLIKIEYNEKYGRHIVATQDIQPGTVIVVEKGFVLFPSMENLYRNCFHCLSIAWNGIPCPSCTVAIYCSEKCKEEAWQQYHDIECSILPYFEFAIMDDDNYVRSTSDSYLFITRLLIQVIKTEELSNIIKKADIIDKLKDNHSKGFICNKFLECNKFCSVYNLADIKSGIFNDICSNILKLLLLKSKIFNDIVNNANSEANSVKTDQDIFFSVLKIFKKLESIAVNNRFRSGYYNMRDSKRLMDLGAILCPFISLFNHSCIPNVQRLCTNNQIILFTSNFVPKGHQLFLNYGVFDSMTKKERHDNLKIHNFVCECQVCKENWPSLQTLRENSGDFQKYFSKIIFKFKTMDEVKIFNNMNEPSCKWLFTNNSIEVAVQVINQIHEIYNGQIAYKCSNRFVNYMTSSFNHFYSIKHDIPADC